MGATAIIFKVLAHLLPFLKEALLGGTHWDIFLRRNRCAILLAIMTVVFIIIYGTMLDATVIITKKMNVYKELSDLQSKEIVELKRQLELKPKVVHVIQPSTPTYAGIPQPTPISSRKTPPVYIVAPKKSINSRLNDLP